MGTVALAQELPEPAVRFAEFGHQLGGDLAHRLRFLRQLGQVVFVLDMAATALDARHCVFRPIVITDSAGT